MTFSVQNILSSLAKSGTAKTSHFEVQITGPGDSSLERDMMYRIDEVEIPGRQMSTLEHRFDNIGPVSKVAYDSTYGELTLSVLLSEDMREKEFFELWQNNMVDTGAFEVSDGRYSQSRFGVKYYEDYVGTVTIRQFASSGELRSIHTMVECFPTAIGGIPMNWSGDETAKMNVTFSYKTYKTTFNKQDQPGLGLGYSLRLRDGQLSGSARHPQIGSISSAGDNLLATVGGVTNRFATIRNF